MYKLAGQEEKGFHSDLQRVESTEKTFAIFIDILECCAYLSQLWEKDHQDYFIFLFTI